MPSQAQQLIDRANALAAGKSGAGNVMPQEWLDVWKQVYGANPDQAGQAHNAASAFAKNQGRAMNTAEIEGLWERLANPVQNATPRPLGPMIANPATGQATHGQPQRGAAFTQPSGGGDIPWDIIEKLKVKYGTGLIDQMTAEPERYGADLRNWAQEFQPQSPWAGGTQPSRPMERRSPNPWQINPAVWDSLGNMGQQLAVGFAEDEGWDAGDYVSQINATRPMGQAPRNVQTQFQMPRGWGR